MAFHDGRKLEANKQNCQISEKIPKKFMFMFLRLLINLGWVSQHQAQPVAKTVHIVHMW
jgi:hypothetical protein